MKSPRRNLVISPIGDESMHGCWLSDRPARNFDVFLVHYGQREDFGRSDADYYVRRQGFKWELIDYVAREQRTVLERYDRIWCPDCDVRVDTAGVNRLFELAKQHVLKLAQPAIAAGEVSYEFLRKRPNVVLRYTPFVEVMCPLFSREAFFRVQPTFLESRSGWGLDLLWPRHFQFGEMAVLDAVGVEHTGKLLRGENYSNLEKLGVNPGEELDRIIAEHGGFNRRLHRKLVRGRIKLPAVWEAERQTTFAERILEKLGVHRSYA
jgi:hypothetical protein